jgi:hypothetical protein
MGPADWEPTSESCRSEIDPAPPLEATAPAFHPGAGAVCFLTPRRVAKLAEPYFYHE